MMKDPNFSDPLDLDEYGNPVEVEERKPAPDIKGGLMTAADVATDFIPGVGEAKDIYQAGKSLQEGDYVGAGISGVAAGLGLIPGVGDLAARGLRSVKQNAADALEVGINELLADGKLLKRYTAETSKNLKEAAKNATVKDPRQRVNVNRPVKKGTPVGARLNLRSTVPDSDIKQIVTLHGVTDTKGNKVKHRSRGTPVSHLPIATLENVEFDVVPGARAKIASGEENKFPAATVDGNFLPDRNLLEEENLEDLVEIGFNPKFHHLFVDMLTGQAVKSAEVATVIGDRVFAKGVKYWKKSEAPTPKKTKSGIEPPSDVRYAEKRKGGLMYQDPGDMMADQERVAMQQGGMVQMPGSMTAAQFNPTNPGMSGFMAPVTIDPVVPQAQIQNNPERPQQMMPMPQMQQSGQMELDLGEAPVGMMAPPVNPLELQAGGMIMDSPEEDFQRMGDPMQVQPMRNPLAVMNPLLNPDLRTA